jgi:F-type H+-transporting ATPase subunit a
MISTDPMHQFRVEPLFEGLRWSLFGYDVSFTNSSLWMVLVTIGAILFFTLAVKRDGIIPGRAQSVAEMMYEFLAQTMRNIAGEGGMAYFPFVFTLFIFILFSNFFGLIPYSFTVTSHIIVTFALALAVFLLVIFVGLSRHGFGFFKLFAPSGAPWWIMPLLVPIEIFSFFLRPISLSVRLCANMFAGHVMLKVFAGFVVGWLSVASASSLVAIAPLIAGIAVTALEMLIAFLQAFVFAVLTCIYLNDALHLHDHH